MPDMQPFWLKMKQGSLLSFGRLVPGSPADRRQGQAAAAAAQAGRLGLPWGGLTPPRKPGRPSKQQLYEEMLVDALRCGRIDEVQLVETSYAPEWWRPGMGLLVEAPAEAYLAAHECVPEPDVMEEAPSVEPGEEAPLTGEETATPLKRRKKISVPRPAQEWFLRWSAHMVAHHKYSQLDCWRMACLWCPEVFGGVHPDTFRRWRPVAPTSAASAGRKCKVSQPLLEKMTVVTLELVKHGTPFAAVHLTALLNKVLEDEGQGVRVSQ